jgi:hypothetical protein
LLHLALLLLQYNHLQKIKIELFVIINLPNHLKTKSMKFLKMKTMTKITTLLLFMFLSTSLFAQNEAAAKNAKAAVTELNKLITSEDPKLTLSESQQVTIEKLFLERMIKISDLKKATPDEEQFKEARTPIFAEYYQKVFVDSMSKEQRMAYQAANKKAKEK